MQRGGDTVTKKLVLEYAKRALFESNACSGELNYRHHVAVKTCVVKGGFAFEARIPRQGNNELGLPIVWGGDGSVTRSEAAEFLRELADMIEDVAS